MTKDFLWRKDSAQPRGFKRLETDGELLKRIRIGRPYMMDDLAGKALDEYADLINMPRRFVEGP